VPEVYPRQTHHRHEQRHHRHRPPSH
jgi:hypothetical protein